MLEDKLKMLRNEWKISQKELAEKLFVSQQTIAKWENKNAKASPDPATLVKIANYFNVSVDYLLGQSRKAENITEHIEGEDREGLSADEQQVVKQYRKNPELHQAVHILLGVDKTNSSNTSDNKTPLGLASRSGENKEVNLTKKQADAVRKVHQRLLDEDDKPSDI